MADTTQPAPPLSKLPVRQFFEQKAIHKKFAAILGNKAPGFITSLLQVVNGSDALLKADPISIFNAAATAASLELPVVPSLGFAWIVPYSEKAQFQIGAKGYIQLAQRTGQYNRMNAVPVFQNQFKSWHTLSEELEADFTIPGQGAVNGYVGYFRLNTRFEKMVYWPYKTMLDHAQTYSKSFSKPDSQWQKGFDKMALKTIMKHTIAPWGPMSIQLETAVRVDQAVIKDPNTLDVEYIDNIEDTPEEKAEKLRQAAEKALAAK